MLAAASTNSCSTLQLDFDNRFTGKDYEVSDNCLDFPERVYAIDRRTWILEHLESSSCLVTLSANNTISPRDILGIGWMLLLGSVAALVSFLLSNTGFAVAFLVAGLAGSGLALGLKIVERSSIRNSSSAILEVRRDGKCFLFDKELELSANTEKILQVVLVCSNLKASGSESSSTWSELNMIVESKAGQKVIPLVGCQDEGCAIIARTLSTITGWSVESCKSDRLTK